MAFRKKAATKRGATADRLKRGGSEPGKLEDKIQADFGSLSYDPHLLTEKIIEFGKVLTGVELYKYQYQFVYRCVFSVVAFENETLTALWSRQSGKSESVAFLIVTLMVLMPSLAKIFPELKQFENGFKIGLYAPQQLQVDTTYDRALDRLEREEAGYILEDPDIDAELLSYKNLNLNNKSSTVGQVASKSSKIESKTFHLIIIEETQDMDDFVMQKSIEPMTSATAGTVIKVGTTGTKKTSFYKDIMENKRAQRKIKDDRLFLHFEFDYKNVIDYKRQTYEKDGNIFHLNYEKDVLKKRRKWGEDSDAFKLGYSLIWPLESGMFCTESAFERMCNRRLGVITPDKVGKDWFICAGLDWANDNDSTVLTIGRSFYKSEAYTTEAPMKQVLFWLELLGAGYEAQHYLILEQLVEWGVEVLYADYTGVGRPPTERLQVACGEDVTIVPYTFTRPSKSDMWVALDADIRESRLIVPANKTTRETPEFDNFKYQLTNLQKSMDGGYMVCNHADEPGEHDDYCDSLGLMVLAGNTDAPEEVEETENIFFQNNDLSLRPNWRGSRW